MTRPSSTGNVRDLFTDVSTVSFREQLIERQNSLWHSLRLAGNHPRSHLSPRTTYVLADAIEWLSGLPENNLHAVVTDPPYGLIEYSRKHHDKLKSGSGGVWRIPPSFDGAKRKPLPRFTVLSPDEVVGLDRFFGNLADALLRVLVPGGHLLIASNPLLSTLTSDLSCHTALRV